MTNGKNTEDLPERKSSTFGSGDLTIKRSTVKLIVAAILFFGGPAAVWAALRAPLDRLEAVEGAAQGNHISIGAVLDAREADRPKIDNINRIVCWWCFEEFGDDTKKCGDPCEYLRPLSSGDDD